MSTTIYSCSLAEQNIHNTGCTFLFINLTSVYCFSGISTATGFEVFVHSLHTVTWQSSMLEASMPERQNSEMCRLLLPRKDSGAARRRPCCRRQSRTKTSSQSLKPAHPLLHLRPLRSRGRRLSHRREEQHIQLQQGPELFQKSNDACRRTMPPPIHRR